MGRFQRSIAVVVVECFFASNISLYTISAPAATFSAPVSALSTDSESAEAEEAVEAAETSLVVTPREGGRLELNGAALEIPPGSVDKPMLISMRALPVSAAPADGIANVTAGARAYRFEPHGTRFLRPVYVSLPFDRELLDSETSLSNTFTYFLNERLGRWERLKRSALDRERAVVTSETTHFTDMINGTLKLPEGPSPIQFDVSSIKNLEAADPSSGVPGVQGLEGGSQGAASFQIPLRLPPGRGGAAPQAALSYSSESPNSWLGRGFDISVPAITIDTRFGLPRYDGTDAYMLAGEELVAAGAEAGGLRFRPLVERGFQRILWRRGGGEDYWEVTEKSGSVSEYGRGEGWIGPQRSARGRTFIWYLTKTKDPFGNTVEYSYGYDAANAFTYLSEIRYSGFEGGGTPEEGAYTVSFNLEDREDRRIDSRGRFPSRLARRLARVDVRYRGDLVRSYVPAYEENEFGQTQLAGWTETDASGAPFYTYAFDYYGLEVRLDDAGVVDGYDGFMEEGDWELPASGAERNLSWNVNSSVGVNLYTGLELFTWVPFVGTMVLFSVGITGGYNYSTGMSRGSLMDINGDGLSDLVWKYGSSLQTLLNVNGAFTEGFSVSGMSDFMEKDTQNSLSIGGSIGASILSASVNYQHTWTEANTSFTDVNGDGFVDFAGKSLMQFGLNNGVSIPGQMALVSTPWVMTGGGFQAPAGDPLADTYERAYYRREPVKKWRAYRSGTVEVTQEASLLYGSSASLDGVRLYTHSNAGSRAISLNRGSQSVTADTSAYAVQRDDPLYFHMETGKAERGDEVRWNARIGYTSVKLFEDLADAAEIVPPAQSEKYLPFGDSRLEPIYKATVAFPMIITYTLKENWRDYFDSVYEPLVEHGCFVPREISKADMDRVLAACADEPDIDVVVDGQTRAVPAKNVLLAGYRYVSESQTLYRVGDYGDQLMLSQLPQAFNSEELKRVAYTAWLDGSRVMPRQSGGQYTITRAAPSSGIPARLLEGEADAAAGETVWERNILLDRLWETEGTPAALESLWLRQDGGSWKLYVRDDAGEREIPAAEYYAMETGDTLYASFADRSVRRTFYLSGGTSLIERLCASAYEGPVSQAVMDGEVLSTYGYEVVPLEALVAIAVDLDKDVEGDGKSQTVGEFVLGCYALDGDVYRLDSTITEGDLARLLGLLEPYAARDGSLFDVFAGDPQGARRFIRLTQEQYSAFMAGQDASTSGCFQSYTDGAATFYRQKPGLSADERTALFAAMYVFRRDVELFPYYTPDSGIRVLKPDLSPGDRQRVSDTLEEAGLRVYTGISRSITYGSGAVLPVTTGRLPDGATVLADAPRGSIEPIAEAEAGIVEVLGFDAEGRTVLKPYYLHVFDSTLDYSTRNLVRIAEPSNPESDAYSLCNGENQMFRGGVYGWYYGTWTGYYAWNAALIGRIPPAPAEGEPSTPPYFKAMDPNTNPVSGSVQIEEDGTGISISDDAWVSEVSLYQEPVMDDEGNVTTVTSAYAAFLDATTMHPSRNGGEAYYNLPPNAPAGDAGSLAFIRTSESSSVDLNGGASLSIAGVNLGASLSSNIGESWQTQGLMDVNGDRFPDLLDFTGYGIGSFSVRPGTGAGFGPVEAYSSPFPYVSFNKNTSYGLGASGSAGGGGIKIDYDDKGTPVSWTIKETASPGGSLGANGTLGSSSQIEGFYDMNGDGLPDHVKRDGTGNFQVALNTGTGVFSSGILDWGSGITTPAALFDGIDGLSSQPSGLSHTSSGSFGGNAGLTIDGGVVGVGVSGGFTGTVNQTYSTLSDMNGDGLPDQAVKLKDEPFFRVRFNLGDKFSDDEVRLYRPEWRSFNPGALRAAVERDLAAISDNVEGVPIPEGAPAVSYRGLPDASENVFSSAMDPFRVDDVLSYASGTSFNLGASVTLRFPIAFLALTVRAGVNGSSASTSAMVQFNDVDGDGLPDHVMKLPGEPFVRVKLNSLGKAGLLRAVNLPQGGRYEVEYARAGNTVDMPQSRWVLSSVTKDDGVGLLATGRGEHAYRVEYGYSGGYYDRPQREFWGFDRVDTRFADGSVQSVWYSNRQYYTRGMEWKRELWGPAGGGASVLLSRKLTRIEQQSEGYYSGKEVVFPRVGSEASRLYDESSGQYTETELVYRYDRDFGNGSYGNVQYIEDKGDTSVEGDELFAFIGYASLPGYFKQHPESIRVEGAGGALLRKREGAYGSRGDLVRLTQYESETVGNSWTVEWDGYGNLESIRDPRGCTVGWEYDDDTHSHIVLSRSSNPLLGGPEYQSSSVWDLSLGVETSRTDIAGETMSFSYDGFGRLSEVRSPYDTGSLPAVSYRYYSSSVPWYVVTMNKVSYDPEDAQRLATVISIDGLGRALQTAKQGEVWSEGERRTGWNLSGAVSYDGKGRGVAEGQPVFAEGEALPALAAMRRPTTKSYDSLDRVRSITLPDGAVSAVSYSIRGGRQVERTVDPKGNISEKILDGRGNTVAVRRLDAAETLLTSAGYSYNAMGEILEVVDFAGNRISSRYDLLGRRVRFESPDAGTVEYAYDSTGNLARKIDSVMRSRGQSIRYVYDELNRLARVDYPRSADTLYTYGGPGAADGRAGRIVRREDESGSVSYRYGRIGETTEMTRTINRLTPGAADESAAISYRYDYLGRMQSITYPDSEVVTYGYDYGGQVVSVTGSHYGNITSYIQDIGYDEYGQRVYIKYGNGVETRYSYDEDRRWLDEINTQTGYGAVYQAMSYSFDEVGNVLGVTNAAGTYQTQASYGYDSLYQLTHAEGRITSQKYGMTDFTSRYTQDFGFSAIGNLMFKTSALSTTPKKTIGAALDYELDYEYYSGKAHQAERVGKMWYRYDANGNVVEEREGGHSELPLEDADVIRAGDVRVVNRGWGLATGSPRDTGVYQRNFVWNEENRLTRSTDSSLTVDYRYGADGERALKYSSLGETLYFDSMWQATADYPDLRQSKHVYVGSSRLATRCNIKGYADSGYEELNTFYYHSDHLGSAQLVTDYRGEKYEHMEYTPYGELWVEEVTEAASKTPFRFTGKEMDEETGLYYYGARYMNPKTSLWMSADPAGQDLNWYSYCANNPVKYTDPTGEKYVVENHFSNSWNFYREAKQSQYPSVKITPSPEKRIENSVAKMKNYLNEAHVTNVDFEHRAIEERGGWLHNFHCNEIALFAMMEENYRIGSFSQNTSINDNMAKYKEAGLTYDLPPIETTGYIFYYGINSNGKTSSWNHQERYEYLSDGTLYIYKTSGQELPTRVNIKDVTRDNIRLKTWKKKTDITFVPTDWVKNVVSED